MCPHCIERGPSTTSVDATKLAEMPTDGPAAVPYENPLAVLEEFMGRRFFFDYSSHYKKYRATGDKSALDSLQKSARYYHSLCERYPSVAQAKASDPEHWNYLFSMAGWSRITLQEALKYPDQVSQESTPELGVDEDFMIAIANAITHNSTTRNGSIQCPSADAIQPLSRKPFGIPREKLFIYEAFRDGLILAQHRLKDNPRAAAAKYTESGDKIWDYFEALRKDRTLIHLGEKM